MLYVIWLRVICIFVTREAGQGNLSEKVISTSARQIHHVFRCVCALPFWRYAHTECISLYVFYLCCVIVSIRPDLARQSDLQWLPSLWILMYSLPWKSLCISPLCVIHWNPALALYLLVQTFQVGSFLMFLLGLKLKVDLKMRKLVTWFAQACRMNTFYSKGK